MKLEFNQWYQGMSLPFAASVHRFELYLFTERGKEIAMTKFDIRRNLRTTTMLYEMPVYDWVIKHQIEAISFEDILKFNVLSIGDIAKWRIHGSV